MQYLRASANLTDRESLHLLHLIKIFQSSFHFTALWSINNSKRSCSTMASFLSNYTKLKRNKFGATITLWISLLRGVSKYNINFHFLKSCM